MENKLTPELIEKAKQAKSVEELTALAKENGIELSEEAAKAHFERLHNSGELSDEELGNVAGGGCGMDYCTCGYPIDMELRVCRACGKCY